MLPVETLDRVVEMAEQGIPAKTAHKDGVPYLVISTNTKVHSLENLVPPTRIKRQVALLEAESFSAYVNNFKNDDTVIFVEVGEQGADFKAVLDYHSGAPELTPHYCEHVAEFSTIQTPEWRTWLEANRRVMTQVQFATWLEDNAALFKEPTGAALLELVRTLEGKSDVRFNSAIRLDSGANKLQYDEDVTLKGAATTSAGAVELPAVISAAIQPFQGAPHYEVRARLKYRIEGRKLALWFETIAMHTIIRDSILLVVKDVAEKTGITPFTGNT